MNKLFKAILVILTVGAVAVVSCYFAIPSFKQTINEKVFKIEQEVEQPKEEDNKSEAEYIIENETLKAENEALKTELGNIKTELEAKALEIETLTTKTQEDKLTIDSLKSNIATHEKALLKALEEKSNLENEVTLLNQACEDLQLRLDELNKQSEVDAEEISNLEAELLLKNKELETVKDNLANKTLEVETLTTNLANVTNERDSLLETVSNQQKQITNLQNSINYYEDYLKNLETEEKVYATFEVDGEVTYIQELYKGAYASHETPVLEGYKFDGWMVDGSLVELTAYPVETNTTFVASFTKLHIVTFVSENEVMQTQQVLNNGKAQNVEVDNTTYKIFNGWILNNSVVNIEDITITEDTTFVASYTYKYDVSFVVDSETTSQIVEQGSKPTAVANPVKDGYEFDGWVLNGSIVNPEEVVINEATVFTASFTKLHTVTFIYENNTVSTQTVRNNEYAQDVEIENTTYKVFNGWLLNGNLVNVESQKITSNVTFDASITYKYDVVFTVDGAEYNKQIIVQNGYATLPENPTKTDCEFVGWTINGLDLVDVASYKINASTTFVAKFKEWTAIYNGSIVVVDKLEATSSSSTFNVDIDELKTTDKIRVTFSKVGLFDGVDGNLPTYYWDGDSFEYKFSNPTIGDLVLTNESTFTVSSVGYISNITLTISCTADGVLTISSSTDTGYSDFTKLTISKIEVFK